jgi:hypothetical protein
MVLVIKIGQTMLAQIVHQYFHPHRRHIYQATTNSNEKRYQSMIIVTSFTLPKDVER